MNDNISFILYNSEKKFSRLLLLIIALTYIIFGFVYMMIPGSDPFTFSSRLIIFFIFLVILILSFVSEKVVEHIYELSRFISFLSIMHLIYMADLNDFSIDYIFSLLVIILIANLIFKTDKYLKYYNIATIIY
jgi:hypothetical protein